MKTLATTLILFASVARAQTGVPNRLDFALPQHPGRLSLARGKWNIIEVSAKPNGQEWGIKAEDGNLHFLGFLFVWPEEAPLTAEKCRDKMLAAEAIPASAAVDRATFSSTSGVEIATSLLIPKDAHFSQIRSFVAAADLCADISVTLAQPVAKQAIAAQQVRDFLRTLTFDPAAKPSFRDAFGYATVLWDHHQLPGAVNAYRAALALVDQSDNPLQWRRVTTDQLSMAQGMSGDLAGSRATNEAAIERDPDYPLYYYNLACADAEAGNATAAQQHLQQAFDRRINTLRNEAFPDPAQDDSIQKLRTDKPFWIFVTSLSKQLKR